VAAQGGPAGTRPDVVVILTDQERAAPPYEGDVLRAWRDAALPARRWFAEHGVTFMRHYAGSLACVPSRPTLFTGQYPDVHGVTQTDGLAKEPDDTAMRWMRVGEVPTLGHWFRAAGYDTSYHGKWHISHADLHDPSTGGSLATNDDAGTEDTDAVAAYRAAHRLDPFGFSDWVGPEPHGGSPANSGLRRDPLTAARAVAWLTDRYARRRAGDAAAARPFLLVVSLVNPHDVVLFPAWLRDTPPELADDDRLGVPPVPPAPTAGDDLTTKPATQRAYRDAYTTGYAPIADGVYDEHAERYRRWYMWMHAEVDRHIDAVRSTVTDGGSDEAVLVLSSDHGELLGAHGGLHQKWFNAYEETVRVPLVIARVGAVPTSPRPVGVATSHVDILPTLVAVTGADAAAIEAELGTGFSEVHPLPGRDLGPALEGRSLDPRPVYLITRDNILEGDTGASVVARALGMADAPPENMRIRVPEDVGVNVEAVVTEVDGRWWKLVRTFDDPATWTEPFVRHLCATGPDGRRHRTEPLPDEWELYDLTADPVEADNRWATTDATLRDRMVATLDRERSRCNPARNLPWPYATRLSR
jgi:arylsulfatase A-like enzyme